MRISALRGIMLLALIVPVVNSQQYTKEIKEWRFLDAKESVLTLALSSNGKMIAVASVNSRDGMSIRIWNLADQSVKCMIQGRSGSRIRMRFVNDDKELISPTGFKDGNERGVRISRWDIATGNLTEERRIECGEVGALSDDGRLVVTYPHYPSKVAHVWDLTAVNNPLTLEADSFFWQSAYFCPQNKTIVTLHPNETQIWEYPSGKLRHKIARKGSMLWTIDPFTLSFSADGKSFHLSYPKLCVTIWNAFSGKPVNEKPWTIEGSSRFSLLPDGKHLVSNNVTFEGRKGRGSDLTIFDVEKRAPVLRLVGTDRVMNLADLVISADGAVVAQSTSNGTISIWQLPKLEVAPATKPGTEKRTP